jgi:flagellar biosynthesis protein FlhA
VVPGHWLAIDLGNAREPLQGIETRDPSFKLKAYWIREEIKDRAQRAGYMVVDIPTVMITHISEIIKRNLHEILGRAEVSELVENLSKKYPKAVQGLVPDVVPLSVLHRVLQNLLREGIPINDLLTIIETLADHIEQTRDPELLTEYVRQRLAKRITRLYSTNGTLYALVLSPRMEAKLTAYVQEGKEEEFLDLVINRLYPKLTQEIPKFNQYQALPLLITSSGIRRHLRKILEAYVPNLVVLSYNELDRQLNMKVVGVIDED